MKTSNRQFRLVRQYRITCILTVFSTFAALLLSGCGDPQQADTPHLTDVTAQTETETAAAGTTGTAAPETTAAAAASTAAMTSAAAETTTAPAERTEMPFGDISEAEIRMTNRQIYPLVFEPPAETRQILADALKRSHWREKERSGWLDCPGTVYIRNGAESFSLYPLDDGTVYFRDGNRVAEYQISRDASETILNALADFEGSELQYYGADIYMEDQIWDKTEEIPSPSGTAPCGDFSNASVCYMDVGLLPSVYVCTDTAVRLISDVFNAAEWEPLPDDATNEIASYGQFHMIYIDNGGFRCSFNYLGGGILVYEDETGRQKYKADGGVFGILCGLFSSVYYNRERIAGTHFSYETCPETVQEFEAVWNGVSEWRAEHPEL